MIPAAVHRGGVVRQLAPGVWAEASGDAAILHTTVHGLIERVGNRLGIIATPRLGMNGVLTRYFTARRAAAAIALARAYATPLPLVDATRAARRGLAPTAANDSRRAP